MVSCCSDSRSRCRPSTTSTKKIKDSLVPLQWSTVFVKDPTRWVEAVSGSFDVFFALLAREVHDWTYHRPSWGFLDDRRLEMGSAAAFWSWRACHLLAALRGNLLVVSPRHARRSKATNSTLQTNLTRDDVLAFRSDSKLKRCLRAADLCQKYLDLVAVDQGESERLLSCVMKEAGHGLPDVVASVDGQNLVTGPDVCAQAALYMQERGTDRMDRLSLDAAEIKRVDARCGQLMDQCRALWRERWNENHAPYTIADLELAVRSIDSSKSALGLPRAAINSMCEGSAALQLACQNRSRFFMIVPSFLKSGRVFHVHKKGKPCLLLSSYRTIVLSSPDLSIAEALWGARCTDDLWAAAGETQFGRRDALLVSVVELDASRIRQFQGLPDGVLYTDEKDAFTTTWPEHVVCQLHDVVGLAGEDLALSWSFLQDSTVSVAGKYARSCNTRLRMGMPEGRLLSPAFFVVAAASLQKASQHMPCLQGLDPPEEAVVAYLQHKDLSDAVLPDMQTCRRVTAMACEGTIPWSQAMESLPSDADRLLALDLASPTRVTLAQYLDDNKLKASSWGALQSVASTASKCLLQLKAELTFGPKKTEYMGRGFCTRLPLDCGYGSAKICTRHVGLGIPMDEDVSMSGLMLQTEHRGDHGWSRALTAFRMLGLPPCAAIATLQSRVLPTACYGAALLIVRPDWQTRLNALQHRWLQALFGLTKKVPRVALLAAVGWPWRLSTLVTQHILLLLARLQSCDPHSETFKVHVLAADCPVSWSYMAHELADKLRIPCWLDFCNGVIPANRSAYKQAWVSYRALITDTLQRDESAWQTCEEQRVGSSRIPPWCNASSWQQLADWTDQYFPGARQEP